jgi:hypothetical protein
MNINFNGSATDITEVSFNGSTDVTEINFNGTVVWQKAPTAQEVAAG